MNFAIKKQQKLKEQKSSSYLSPQKQYSIEVQSPPQPRPSPRLNVSEIKVNVELQLVEIQGVPIRELVSILQPLGSLQNCKFTNESKSEAYVKFSNVGSKQELVLKVESLGRISNKFKVTEKE